MSNDFQEAVSALRAVAEPTRLRLLALLARAELTVGEICEVVGQSQPRVSRHLKLLCDAQLLDRGRERHWVYYRAPSAGPACEHVRRLLSLVDEDDEVLRRDQERMGRVIDERARRVADQLPQSERKGALQSIDTVVLRELAGEPLGALLDVGTGAGHLLALLGAHATRAVGIDISSDVLRIARTTVHGAGLSHCELKRGDMYDLPFAVPLFDTAIADRLLGEAERPVAALAEIARTLKHRGRLLVIEDFDRLAESGDANPIATLRGWFEQARVKCERLRPYDTEHGHWLVALGRRIVRNQAAA